MDNFVEDGIRAAIDRFSQFRSDNTYMQALLSNMFDGLNVCHMHVGDIQNRERDVWFDIGFTCLEHRRYGLSVKTTQRFYKVRCVCRSAQHPHATCTDNTLIICTRRRCDKIYPDVLRLPSSIRRCRASTFSRKRVWETLSSTPMPMVSKLTIYNYLVTCRKPSELSVTARQDLSGRYIVVHYTCVDSPKYRSSYELICTLDGILKSDVTTVLLLVGRNPKPPFVHEDPLPL